MGTASSTTLTPAEVARSYYARPGQVPSDDAATGGRGAADLDRVERHLALARVRPAGQPVVEVVESDGVVRSVYIAVDDQALLVEAAVVVVEQAGLSVRRVDHPIFAAVRDDAGALVSLTAVGSPDADVHAVTESWIGLQVSPARGSIDADDVRARLIQVIERIGGVHTDAPAMLAELGSLADVVRAGGDGEQADLLAWLSDGHFLALGSLQSGVGDTEWSAATGVFFQPSVPRPSDPARVPDTAVSIGRVHLPTGVIRTEYPTAIRVVEPGADGRTHLFIGILTSAALHTDVLAVPVLRTVATAVLARAGVGGDSYAGATLLELLQNQSRAELFGAAPEDLAATLIDVLDAIAAREVRVYLRADPASEIVTARIYLPRDRYTTRLREQMQTLLVERLGGRSLEYTARISDSPLAFVHVIMRVDRGTCELLAGMDPADPRRAEIQTDIAAAARSWDDDLRAIAGGAIDADLVGAYAAAIPQAYKNERDPRAALTDVVVLAGLADGDHHVRLRPHSAEPDDRWTFGLYLCGRSASLTSILPMLQSLGVDVLDEHPFAVTRPDGIACWIYEFTIVPAAGVGVAAGSSNDLQARFTDAFSRLWTGVADVDPFNELVLRCGLGWREVVMLRAYSRYLRQCGFASGARHVTGVLGDHPEIAAALGELFAVSFDPERVDDDARVDVIDRLDRLAADVLSLDADRIISAFSSVVKATSRTNFYSPDAGAALAFKLRPREIPQTPQPRPLHEIFVYSPRVEGVHLRFGSVARGGLRWSDRREDFRTEILGLVKAQAVKNAVIVPVGAKGGFVVRQPPTPTGDPSADRDATRAAGVAAYREFISALLDLTDNLDVGDGTGTAAVVPAPGVVRRDGDDTYLVVAADKGTATFSDIANEVAAAYGFWLGDAFASGGSVGYDHKAMGITARGAWESVTRHFREMGTDVARDDFTVVGVGDMSGDVFGNGMLLSEHIRLVAAFDHRHIFIDPDPDAPSSFVERRRLFDLSRSSWADYDTTLISDGGGVWSRESKSIPIAAGVRDALGLDGDVEHLSPPELMRAILLAPVDLLWNGGIGTYVKASTESHADVGDKANDGIRVDGNTVRAKVIGEGGNLGVTEHGRIEFDMSGGRINTDAMDNSAGVDCSDHEVNIKILLDSQVASGALAPDDRNRLLESMTDEVGRLVLADNISQNSELGTSRGLAGQMRDVHARLLGRLAADHGVDLELEALPHPDDLVAREGGAGLTSPELATMMAHVKLALKDDLLDGDLPDNDAFDDRLIAYFPQALQESYPSGIAAHPLRRQIVTTTLVNDLVDTSGIEHVFALGESTGASSTDTARAFVVVAETFGLSELRSRIVAAPGEITAIDEMLIHSRRLLFRASRWFVATRPQPMAIAAEITRYADRVAALDPHLPEWLGDSSLADIDAHAARWESAGIPADIAHDVAGSLHRFCLLDIIDAAEISDRDTHEVGALYGTLLDHLGVEQLLTAVSDLESGDRWQSLARLALRDDLFAVLRAMTLAVLEVGEPDESPREKIAEWELHNASRLSRARATLDEIALSGHRDLATLSVAARQLRSVIR
ncbi:NAD-glutamate dehydrogenase [Williamsia sp.]|uniref:NAD-glutamate dehydrogenase n=1 Tax=Williamsia sp. TaxID=1872085 RepID=UPI001A315F7A|nr:NAD-glutamate dehydrogenase [Williamsia sp.]MBJ7290504.1 NAD-glutamate dehydrogenase [Williamsia sp.]